MIFQSIILVSIAQILLYLLVDYFKIRFVKGVILVAVLLVQILVVGPNFIIPNPNVEAGGCGLPALAMMVAAMLYSIFAGLSAFIVHGLYALIRRTISIINNGNS